MKKLLLNCENCGYVIIVVNKRLIKIKCPACRHTNYIKEKKNGKEILYS
jgi:phage FluMu protein Com